MVTIEVYKGILPFISRRRGFALRAQVKGHSALYFKEEGLCALRAQSPFFRAMVTTLHAIYQIYVQDGTSESVQGHFAIYLKFRKHLAKFAKPLLTRLIRIRS